ncbi:MAG TPA: sensor histidine kinase [Actinomycetota bacterium]|nr:sensor histidine kinase [Actinomycetota bacterium]
MALAITRPFIGEASEGPSDTLEHLFALGATAAFATVGALITSRQPGNRVGLLLSAVGGAAALSTAAGAYTTLASQRRLAGVELGAWVSTVGFIAMVGPLAFLFLLFPTGHVPTPRWRWLLRVMLAAYGVAVTGFVLTPGRIESGFVDTHLNVTNPIAFPLSWLRAVQAVTTVAGLTLFIGALVSVVSLVQRFRRADAEARQQIRWLAYLAAFLGVFLLLFLLLEFSGVIPEDDESVLGSIGFFVVAIGLFFGIPAACGVAILRYRLYDLDIVVKRTVVFGVLVVLLLAVGGLGALVLGGSLVPSLYDLPPLLVVFGAAMGLLVLPFYRLANRIADRLVYGGRTSPYEAMATFARRVGDTYANEDVLIRMATILRETTRARSATVWLSLGGAFRPAATAGEPIDDDLVRGTGSELPPLPGDHTSAVRHQGDLLGALTVVMPASDPVDRARAGLIDDLASQAGAVLRNVRLIEDLRASRQRLVAAQDEERRKIERNLHDGAQQQLVALAVQLRLLESAIAKDPPKAQQQTVQLRAAADDALENLRDLARGIYPPLLADQGLAAALEAQARKAPVPTKVEADGVARYAQEIESAIYFSCLEALQNVAKYAGASKASIRLTATDRELAFGVSDDGVGFDPSATRYGTGLQGMADRLEAIGGTLTIESEPGRGTSVTGRVRVGGDER